MWNINPLLSLDLLFFYKFVAVHLHFVLSLQFQSQPLLIPVYIIYRRKFAGRVRAGPGAGGVEGLCEWFTGP